MATSSTPASCSRFTRATLALTHWPTQASSSAGLPDGLDLPLSQCQSDDYCAVKGSLAPLAPPYQPPHSNLLFRLVNPETTQPGAPRALHVTRRPGAACPPRLIAAEAAVGPTAIGMCAGVAPSGSA